jgi:hypothetical protein
LTGQLQCGGSAPCARTDDHDIGVKGVIGIQTVGVADLLPPAGGFDTGGWVDSIGQIQARQQSFILQLRHTKGGRQPVQQGGLQPAQGLQKVLSLWQRGGGKAVAVLQEKARVQQGQQGIQPMSQPFLLPAP